jgi:hypothetical protein
VSSVDDLETAVGQPLVEELRVRERNDAAVDDRDRSRDGRQAT